MPARAIDQIACSDPLALSGRRVMHGRDDAVAVALEGFEAAVVTQLHGRKAPSEPPQDRIEPDLVAALRTLRRGRQRRVAAMGRPLDAAELIALEPGRI